MHMSKIFWQILTQCIYFPLIDPLNPHNLTVELGFEFENDDCAWVMACVFIIFTMQTGKKKGIQRPSELLPNPHFFTGSGLLSAGFCSAKNETSQMIQVRKETITEEVAFSDTGYSDTE